MNKKSLFLALFCIFVHFVFADDGYIENWGGGNGNITIGKLSLFILEFEADWSERVVFYNSKTKEISEIKDITEQAIYSARNVKNKKNNFFEIVGVTHQGRGNIYLFDKNGKLFFSYYFMDSNMEEAEFPDFEKIPFLQEAALKTADEKNEGRYAYSKIFRDGKLNIDYSKYDEVIIKIYGIADYVGRSLKDDQEKVFASEEIERVFSLTKKEWVLTESKGSIEDISNKW